MKLLSILPLAALSTAFVIPDQEVMSSVAIENHDSFINQAWDILASPSEIINDVEDSVIEALGCARGHFSDAVDYAFDKSSQFGTNFEEAFDTQSWLESAHEQFDQLSKPPKRPHKKPHHTPHHDFPNETIYELISNSKYTTVLAKLIDDYPDLVETLNGTKANYTLFVPTDKAFKKIPKHAPKPSKEFLKKVLEYHISPEFYPAGRVLTTRTIPTLFKSPALGDAPQRLSSQISLKGLTLDFYSKIFSVNHFATNGVIHAIDSILVPPPKVIDILRLLPSEFSTLDLALYKTGIGFHLNDTSAHTGGTIFAPSNGAFKKLGPKINAFLFSIYGEKYLKALLEYHLVANYTLYSDAFYKGEDVDDQAYGRIPKGQYHVDLPTALDGKSLSIDIGRFGRLIEIKINGYNRVAIADGIAADGVIHVVNSVLIPPKKPGVFTEANEDLTVEEFKERLEQLHEGEADWSTDL
ncbi:putative fasciclin domain family protein [Phaeomoniella chlamydospora]|uniref:Putative fasciclin domain family protein n=1 Tax=Phaeomoniella chlamydospora TaxID=158046 RepID=A0A0G2DWB4_PHACM|nr:putative fasciclin domain family protein [Phaeomoniella chlamydospora]